MATISKTTISINYKKAKQQADKVEELANKLMKMSNSNYEEVMQSISANWKGENASMYLNKGARLQGDINQTAKRLQSIASEIRTTAFRLYQAEMRALAIAQERKYK